MWFLPGCHLLTVLKRCGKEACKSCYKYCMSLFFSSRKKSTHFHLGRLKILMKYFRQVIKCKIPFQSCHFRCVSITSIAHSFQFTYLVQSGLFFLCSFWSRKVTLAWLQAHETLKERTLRNKTWRKFSTVHARKRQVPAPQSKTSMCHWIQKHLCKMSIKNGNHQLTGLIIQFWHSDQVKSPQHFHVQCLLRE